MCTEKTGRPQQVREWKLVWSRLWRNRVSIIGLLVVSTLVIIAAFAPHLAPYPDHGGAVVRFARAHEPPSREHLFGTDEMGRDVLSRVILGSRLSLLLAVVVISLAMGIGVPLGLIAGYWGGTVNIVIMRITEIFLAVPPLVLALAASAAFPPSLTTSMLAITLVWWPWYARLTQAEVLRVKKELFVQASQALGASRWRIAVVDILPHVIPPVLVKATLDMGFVILLGAALSFLGLGAQPPEPDWGTMIARGRIYLPGNWWAVTFPGLAIFVTILGFNLLGDALRDLFDVEIGREYWIK